MNQITNAPRSSGKDLAELHDASHVSTSLYITSAAAAAVAAIIHIAQITNAPRSSGKELGELHDASLVATSSPLTLLLLLRQYASRRSRMRRAAVARSLLSCMRLPRRWLRASTGAGPALATSPSATWSDTCPCTSASHSTR
jgi:hypothetical protein